jgi:hypothetical protein
MPQPLAPPSPFQQQSFALVPVQPPQFNFTPPQFNFTAPPFDSSPRPFGHFGSSFGSGNSFAPQLPSGFSFGSPGSSQSPVHTWSPGKGPRNQMARVAARESDERRGMGIKKPARYRPSGAEDSLTLRKVIEHMMGQGIKARRITRAAIRYRDPATGQMRTLTFARSGLPFSTRRRPIWSIHSTGLPQSGGMPQFTPAPLVLPIVPTPVSPQFASIFGNGNGIGNGTGSLGALASATVEVAIVEYDESDDF